MGGELEGKGSWIFRSRSGVGGNGSEEKGITNFKDALAEWGNKKSEKVGDRCILYVRKKICVTDFN